MYYRSIPLLDLESGIVGSLGLHGCHFESPIDRDTLAWAIGTRVGASDHTIALFCIGSGRVLGFLYFKTLIVWFNCAHR